MKIREPKNLNTYLSADEAGQALEQLAADIRAARDPRLRVKWSVQIAYWNPAWNEPGWPGNMIVRQVSYTSGPQEGPAE
jgi:hypothetical protein